MNDTTSDALVLDEGSRRLTYAQLGAQIHDKMTDVVLASGVMSLPCPVCNGRANLMLGATEQGDAVWCNNGCEDGAVDRTLRFLVDRLPGRCPEPSHERFPSKQCSRCLTYSTVAQQAYRQLARGEADSLAEADDEDGWLPTSLTSDEEVPEPTVLRVDGGQYLLRRGEVALVSGLPGSAKTPLAYLGVVDAVRRGQVAAIIDHEMGRRRSGTLLRELGLTEEELNTQVIYYEDPPPLTHKGQAQVVQRLSGLELAYVVIDALADSMPSGSSQNDAADVNAWFAAMPKFFAKQFEAAVLVIDHSNKVDGPDPGGSVRKQGVPDFRMWLRQDKGFSKVHEEGRSTLIVQRDRSGTYAKGQDVAELRNELREGRSVFVLRQPSSSQAGATSGGDTVDVDLGAMSYPDQVRSEVLETLRSVGSEGIMKTKVTDPGDVSNGGGEGAKARRKALEWLEKRGQAERRKEPGTARGERWWAAEFAPSDGDE